MRHLSERQVHGQLTPVASGAPGRAAGTGRQGAATMATLVNRCRDAPRCLKAAVFTIPRYGRWPCQPDPNPSRRTVILGKGKKPQVARNVLAAPAFLPEFVSYAQNFEDVMLR